MVAIYATIARLIVKPLFFSLVIFIVSLVFANSAFALTTSYRSARIVTEDSWPHYTNLGNCWATDGLTCDRASANSYGNLYFRDFGTYSEFGIPDGAKITKVRIRVTGKVSAPIYVGVSAGTTFRENCQWPSDLWPFGLLIGSIIKTQTYVTEVADQFKVGAVRSYCLTPYNFDNKSFIWRINYASSQMWSANIDNFEIAFDYDVLATPTPTSTPTPTPTVIPTPTPAGPAPFLDLPWDYTGKKFSDEALNIYSFFDHEYPLIFSEPESVNLTVVNYLGRRGISKQDIFYSGHNGYDYPLANNTPVLAPAAGTATYMFDNSGGNTIMINHHNGYFTWYMHMLPLDLVVNVPNNKPVDVKKGQMIGRVGSTGAFTTGPHLHFSVIKDVNKNDTFDWNVDYPYGLTDPYKWRGDGSNGTLKDDPWLLYQNGNSHGSKSDYLWIKPTDATVTQVTKTGGAISQNNLSLTFLADTISNVLNLRIDEQAASNASEILKGIGHTFDITASDQLDNQVKTFLQPVTLTMDYASRGISNFIEDTLSFFYFDTQQMQWIKMPSTVDVKNKTVTTQTTHFTQFAVMGELRDTTPPTTSFALSGDKGQDNWYRSDVIIAINGEDNPGGLGIKQIFYSMGDNLHWQEYADPLHFAQEGHYKIFARAIDNGGNVQKEDSILEFDIDKTSPVVTANPDRNTDSNGWYNHAVIFSFTGVDTGSGIDSCEAPVTYNEPDSSTASVTGSCTDKAGNVGSTTFTFKYDATVPDVTIIPNPSIIWPPNNKMVDVKVNGNATDLALKSTSFSVEDEYHNVEPIITSFGQTIKLEAKRNGVDMDGRVYILKVVVEDLAGNKTEKQAQVIVPHDER